MEELQVKTGGPVLPGIVSDYGSSEELRGVLLLKKVKKITILQKNGGGNS